MATRNIDLADQLDSLVGDEIKKLEEVAKQALALAINDGMQYAKNRFRNKYKAAIPTKIWESGFKLLGPHDDGLGYTIVLEGDWAHFFDEGGNIVPELMKTPRAQQQGYLDIPLELAPKQNNKVKVGSQQININVFKDADQVASSYNKSTSKKPYYKQVAAQVKRHQKSGLIESKESKKPAKYMVIRQIRKNSLWKSHPRGDVMTPTGQDYLGDYIERQFFYHLDRINGRT